MPRVTKEQYEAAAEQVAKTAPAGLSEEQFFQLVDKQLAPRPQGPTTLSMLSGSDRVTSDEPEHEPDTFMGGFIKGLKREFNPMEHMKSAAEPKSLGDVSGMLLPSLYEGAVGGAIKGLRSAGAYAAEQTPKSVFRYPGRVMRGLMEADKAPAPPRGRGSNFFERVPADVQPHIPDPRVPTTEVKVGGRRVYPNKGAGAPGLDNPGYYGEAPRPPHHIDLPEETGPLTVQNGLPPEFNDLPLEEQMRSFPETGPMPQGRPGVPPSPSTGTPFHERPLYQQMEQLPETGTIPERMRSGGPPVAMGEDDSYERYIKKFFGEGELPSAGPEVPNAPTSVEAVPPTGESLVDDVGAAAFTAEEEALANRLASEGVAIDDIADKIYTMREMQKRYGLPSTQQATDAVKIHNAEGRYPDDLVQDWKPRP